MHSAIKGRESVLVNNATCQRSLRLKTSVSGFLVRVNDGGPSRLVQRDFASYLSNLILLKTGSYRP